MGFDINSRTVLGHIFEAGNQSIFYNVHDQGLVVLHPLLAAILPHFEDCLGGEIPAEVRQQFSQQDIQAALTEVQEAAQNDDMFLRRPPELVPAAKVSHGSADYARNLQQLVLTVTENCNLRCQYCLHGANLDWVRPHGQRRMAPETALEATRYFLDCCQKDPKPTVSFYGGEALLEWDLIETVVREVRRHPSGKEALLTVDTNGVLLSREIIEAVVRHGLYLQISLDGPRRLHDRQRQDSHGRGTFSRIMQGLDYWFSIDPEAHERLSLICTVAAPTDLDELDRFFAIFPPHVRHGIKSAPRLSVNLANLNGQSWPASRQEIEDLQKQISERREIYYQALATGQMENLGPVTKNLVESRLFKVYHRSRAPLGESYTPGGNCRPGLRKLHVTAGGRLQPCERTGDSIDLGRVSTGLDAAAVDELQGGFFETVKSHCENCWALRLCTLCFAGYAEHHRPGQTWPESVCDSIRKSIEDDLKLLVRILELPPESRSFLDEVTLI